MAEQQTSHTQPGYRGSQQHHPSASVERPSDVKPIPMQQINVAQPVQYEMEGAPMPITTYPRPSYASPHSYLALVLITMIICCVLNITSVAFGIPALILSTMSYNAVHQGKWDSAQKLGKGALYLTIINWIYTLSLTLLFFILMMKDYYQRCYSSSYWC